MTCSVGHGEADPMQHWECLLRFSDAPITQSPWVDMGYDRADNLLADARSRVRRCFEIPPLLQMEEGLGRGLGRVRRGDR